MSYNVVDLHCDSVASLMHGKELRRSVPEVHIDVPRLKAGKVGMQVFAAYVPPETEAAFNYAAKLLDTIDEFARSDAHLTPVETAAQAKTAMACGKTGIMLAVENGLAIESSLKKLEELRRKKVRMMTLVHSEHMPWIASCTGSGNFIPEGVQASEQNDRNERGLSRFGEQVVDAMHDLGIIPDVSHSSVNAFWDVIRRSKKPIVATHSCAYSICAAARNLNDDQLKAMGDSGSVIGVNFCSTFLSDEFRLWYQNNKHLRQGFTVIDSPIKVPMSLVLDHIDHMVNIAGEDCIALGSDFDGIPSAPDGITGCDFYPVLEQELRQRGYSDTRIEKIFNGNFLRLLEVWDC